MMVEILGGQRGDRRFGGTVARGPFLFPSFQPYPAAAWSWYPEKAVAISVAQVWRQPSWQRVCAHLLGAGKARALAIWWNICPSGRRPNARGWKHA